VVEGGLRRGGLAIQASDTGAAPSVSSAIAVDPPPHSHANGEEKDQTIAIPPFTCRVCPVTYAASSDDR